MIPIEPPNQQSDYYTCPHCGTLTGQEHQRLYRTRYTDRGSDYAHFEPIMARQCSRCKQFCIWFKGNLLYPLEGLIAAAPHPDLPDEIRADVEEARMIVSLSARSAAALLRLALERLCLHLDAKGSTLDAKIRWLVSNRRLDPMVQQTLDVVRVVGNEAVHPGVLDLRDKGAEVVVMFDMLNEIVEELISRPQRIQQRYQSLPSSVREAAEAKDLKNRQEG